MTHTTPTLDQNNTGRIALGCGGLDSTGARGTTWSRLSRFVTGGPPLSTNNYLKVTVDCNNVNGQVVVAQDVAARVLLRAPALDEVGADSSTEVVRTQIPRVDAVVKFEFR
jgi:hypothetical protein